MAQIGTFTRHDDGEFTGTIQTLGLNLNTLIRPVPREHDKAPDHRVSVDGYEFGASWTKSARDTGTEYLSVKMDDPMFPSPVYATLTLSEDGETYKLIWSR